MYEKRSATLLASNLNYTYYSKCARVCVRIYTCVCCVRACALRWNQHVLMRETSSTCIFPTQTIHVTRISVRMVGHVYPHLRRPSSARALMATREPSAKQVSVCVCVYIYIYRERERVCVCVCVVCLILIYCIKLLFSSTLTANLYVVTVRLSVSRRTLHGL